MYTCVCSRASMCIHVCMSKQYACDVLVVDDILHYRSSRQESKGKPSR